MSHEHDWQPPTIAKQNQVDPSPCSRLDDHLYTEIIGVQRCECGAVRSVLLGFENRRRRGDDVRRKKGLDPLGIPLQRSGTFARPGVLAIKEP